MAEQAAPGNGTLEPAHWVQYCRLVPVPAISTRTVAQTSLDISVSSTHPDVRREKISGPSLPLITTYVDYRVVANPFLRYTYWSDALTTRITNRSAKAIRVPLIQDALFVAIRQFSANDQMQLGWARNYDSERAHRNFGAFQSVGLRGSIGSFVNTRKSGGVHNGRKVPNLWCCCEAS